MEKEQFLLILTAYLNGKATAEEENFLFAYYNLFMADVEVIQLLNENERQKLKFLIKTNINGHIDKPKLRPVSKKVKLWPRIAVASSIILVMAAGLLFYRSFSNHEDLRHLSDIRPGTNKATLILTNGRTIELSSKKNGVIIDASKLSYNDGSEISSASQGKGLLTISTPRGGTYLVKLPDGTLVTLNAASSLQFPATFSNVQERKVTLTGEAYFVVKHNTKKPFRVKTAGQVVEDIGTEFNISAYADEAAVKTTLIEGSARVIATSEVVLKPNQQSNFSRNTLVVQEVNAENALAWKKGLFMFNDEPLEEVMRKISRWYSTEVIFKDESLKQMSTYGTISRSSKLSKVLEMMEKTGYIHFEMEGRRIIVTK